MKWLLDKIKGDKAIWAVVMFLSLASLFVVFSSIDLLRTTSLFLKHTVFLVAGIGVMYLVHLMDYRYFARFSQILLILVVPLLIFTLFWGINLNDASRWIHLPVIDLTFQPSDAAKLILIMYLARMIARKQLVMDNFVRSLVPIVLPVLAVCFFIGVADLSTALVLFFTSFILMIVGRVSWRHISALAGAGFLVALISGTVLVSTPDAWLKDKGRLLTWKNRMMSFVQDGEQPQQVVESKLAIVNGGWLGQGPGHGQQRAFLPGAYSDYVYAVVIEEFGLFGGLFIVGLYLILFERSLVIFRKCRNSFGALLAIGLSLSLVIQALVHMAVVVNLVPVTGLPLPLVSKGGTSMLFTCIALGIILSVSRTIDEEDEKNGGSIVPAL